ncbi:MAG: DEAD/DEAH box helicase family protein [Candidatus Kuenenia sp.]|nr:DEAD/DEAH box helicase family protein [Candidatus Kuenenia sp.]
MLHCADSYKKSGMHPFWQMDLSYLKKDMFSHPKYCMKMATGTGKTWVMNALLIWQYLNARHEKKPGGCYSTNFLLVAPGLIVYERLLDAYLGKQKEDGSRDFENSDLMKSMDLSRHLLPQKKTLGVK